MCRDGDGDGGGDLTVTAACAVPPHAVEEGCLQAGDRDPSNRALWGGRLKLKG
eukprot:COSAG01_NODE_665_length_14398_cov_91.714595_2_plen_53_part_00